MLIGSRSGLRDARAEPAGDGAAGVHEPGPCAPSTGRTTARERMRAYPCLRSKRAAARASRGSGATAQRIRHQEVVLLGIESGRSAVSKVQLSFCNYFVTTSKCHFCKFTKHYHTLRRSIVWNSGRHIRKRSAGLVFDYFEAFINSFVDR